MKNEPSSKTDAPADWDRSSGRRLFVDGLRISLSTPGIILVGSSAGFGALANDAGMSAFNAMFMMAVFFALPAQVVMMDQLARGGSILAGALAVALTGVRLVPMMVVIMPWLSDGRSSTWRRFAAAHFVAVTAWLEGMRTLPSLPEGHRMTVFLGIGTGLVASTLVGTAIGFALAESVPPAVAAGLLFLTPIYFFLSLMAAARLPIDAIAISVGALLGPPIYLLTPGFDLLLTGLIGGTLAYAAARWRRHKDGGSAQ